MFEGFLIHFSNLQWFPDLFLNDPDFREIFAPNGTLLKEGDPIERNNYAFTLLEVAKGGADAFYNGVSPSLLSLHIVC